MKSQKYLIFVGMGLELVGIILTCIYVGQKIDEILGFQGLAMAGLSLVGLAGWITHIVILSSIIDRNSKEQD